MPLGVGVIGAGTVGGGVVQTLTRNPGPLSGRAGTEIVLRHVAELNDECLTAFDLQGVRVTKNASGLIADPDVHVVCELIGGIDPARAFILEALSAGKHVVTANKMLLALHGPELCEAAVRNGVDLRYEAAVAGGIPIIKALREGLAANEITHVYGILNGTCNYILSRMTYDNMEFDDALARAVRLGFAETPPDLDIEGHDTAHKCQIIASLCSSSRVTLDDIYVEGVTGVTHADVSYAGEMGYTIKLLAVVRVENGETQAAVYPALVEDTHLLASVREEFNAVYVRSDIADATLYYGRGAGRMPTASAVLADIADIARQGGTPAQPPFTYGAARRVKPIGELEGRFYLCLTTLDQPGVLGKVCTILGDHGVSIASCIQKETHAEETVHVVMMTHETREAALRDALSEVDGLDFIRSETRVLHVLQENAPHA